jgi:predicted metalloendopeptidase
MKASFLFFVSSIFAAPAKHKCTPHTPKPVTPLLGKNESFYEFVNAEWLAQTVIPDSAQRVTNFDYLNEQSVAQVKSVVDGFLQQKNSKLYVMYNAGIDTKARDAAGWDPIKPFIQEIDAIASLDDLMEIVGKMNRRGVGSPFFSFYVGSDPKNSNFNILQAGQGRLMLADKTYYDNKDAKKTKLKAGLVKYVDNLVSKTFGSANSSASVAEQFIKFETDLAAAFLSRDEESDPNATYNKLTFAEFKKLTPELNWARFLAGAGGIPEPAEIVISSLAIFKSFNKLLKETSLDTLKTYLKAVTLTNVSAHLSGELVELRFDFFSRTIRGVQKNKDTWELVQGVVSRSFQDLVGKEYVKNYFPESSKAAAMAVNIC